VTDQSPTSNRPSLAEVSALLPSRQNRAKLLVPLIADHLSTHGGYVAWSGGKDSTAVVEMARRAQPDVPVVWFDSGLEYPENCEYIHKVSRLLNLNLHIIKAEPTALDVLVAGGSWDHQAVRSADIDLHDILIAGPSAQAHTQFGAGELTGLRAEESAGRRALLATGRGHYSRTDGSEVYAPIWSWSSLDVQAHLIQHGIPENPVYEKLRALGAPETAQRVGLVVDGNNIENGRYTYLRLGWPDLWSELCKALPRLNEWR
jgi:phosphoadenosine phosphosulfate reductase